MSKTVSPLPPRYRRAVKHVVILGAGFAGLELATRLSESLPDEVRVTLLDKSASFSFGFAKLAVLQGRRSIEDVSLPYSQIAKTGVEFRQERITAIDPETRRVTTDQGSYDADFLAVGFSFLDGVQQQAWRYQSGGGSPVIPQHRLDLEGALLRSWIADGSLRVRP